MAAEAQRDIFISYTSSDWNWAKWLDFILLEAGHTTVVQGYDFVVGQSFVAAMHEALRVHRWVACLLSPAYLQSDWCKKEWQAGLTGDQFFLIRVADCEPDGLLRPIAYLDLVGAAQTTAKDLVLTELRKRAGGKVRPSSPPPFSNGTPAVRPRRFPTALPPIWNIPEQRNPYFTGRENTLNALHEALSAGNTAALTQAVKGLGGVGKTQVALEYAYRYAGEYEGIWWLRAEQPVTLAQDYAALGPKLGLPATNDQPQLIRDVRHELSQRQQFLLIFDNATEPATLKDYLPQGNASRVVVTTRAHVWPKAAMRDVAEWTLDSAVAFLHKRVPDCDTTAATKLAERLGCLPLALEQAAAYMETCERGLKDYLQLLQDHGLEVAESVTLDQYEKTVGTTWSLAFEQVQQRCPAAADLLNLCAFLAPDAIDLSDLARVAENLPERLGNTLKSKPALNNARTALLAFSLVRAEGDQISLHRLVQEVTRNRLPADARDEWHKAALTAVDAIIPVETYDIRTWPICAQWLNHALQVTHEESSATLLPQVTSRLLNQAGMYLTNKADFLQAESLYRRALEIDEASLGPKHPEVARNLNNLALLLKATNRLGEAEPLMRRALEIDEASFGPKHPEVAIDLNSLASLLLATNWLSEAEPLMRRALEIDEASFGSKHPEVARDLNNLGQLLQATNRLGEAEPLMRRALEIDEASFGPKHPKVARDLNNLAMLLQDTNRLGEAEPLMRRALGIFEASLGSEHPSTLTVRGNLERLLAAMAHAAAS